jgi:hypothetical protein
MELNAELITKAREEEGEIGAEAFHQFRFHSFNDDDDVLDDVNYGRQRGNLMPDNCN